MDHEVEDPRPRDLLDGPRLVAMEEGDGTPGNEPRHEGAVDLDLPRLPGLRREEAPVAIVVPEDADAGAGEGSEPGDDEGGDIVPRMEDEPGGEGCKPRDGPVHHGEVVMGIREDPDAHVDHR